MKKGIKFVGVMIGSAVFSGVIIYYALFSDKKPTVKKSDAPLVIEQVSSTVKNPISKPTFDNATTAKTFNFPRVLTFQNLTQSNSKLTAISATFLNTTCQNVTGEFDAAAALLKCRYGDRMVQFYIKGNTFQLVHPMLQLIGTLTDQSVTATALYQRQNYTVQQQTGQALQIYTEILSGALPCPNQPTIFSANKLLVETVELLSPLLKYNPTQDLDFTASVKGGGDVNVKYQSNGKAALYLNRLKLSYPLEGRLNTAGLFESPPVACPTLEGLKQAMGQMNIELEALTIHNLNLPKLAKDAAVNIPVSSLTDGSYLTGRTSFGPIKTEVYWAQSKLVLPATQSTFQGGVVQLQGTLSPFDKTLDMVLALKFETLPEAPPLRLKVTGNIQQPSLVLADQLFVKFLAGRKLRGFLGVKN